MKSDQKKIQMSFKNVLKILLNFKLLDLINLYILE